VIELATDLSGMELRTPEDVERVLQVLREQIFAKYSDTLALGRFDRTKDRTAG